MSDRGGETAVTGGRGQGRGRGGGHRQLLHRGRVRRACAAAAPSAALADTGVGRWEEVAGLACVSRDVGGLGGKL